MTFLVFYGRCHCCAVLFDEFLTSVQHTLLQKMNLYPVLFSYSLSHVKLKIKYFLSQNLTIHTDKYHRLLLHFISL